MNKYLLPLLPLAGLCAGCLWKNSEDCTTDLYLRLYTTVSQAQDTFHVNDTIWIESVIPDTLTDFRSGIQYDASTVETFLNIDFQEELVIDSAFVEHHFRMVEIENNVDTVFFGEINSNPVAVSFRVEYLRKNNKTGLKVGLVPKKTGLFSFRTSFLLDDYNKFELDENCNEVVRAIQVIPNNGNTNYHLFDGFVPFHFDSSEFRIRGGFAFRVVE